MFLFTPNKKVSVKLKGFFMRPIQYEERVLSGDWSVYFGKYQNQKWGIFDTDSCWCLACINSAEDQLEWLDKNGLFSPEAINFFVTNGYKDADGDYSLSERYLEILGGNRMDGGSAPEAWQLMQKYGCIPRSDLTYSLAQVQKFSTVEATANDYFNPAAITPAMRAKGQQFLKYVNIAYQIIGKNSQTPNIQILKAALKQSPVNIGIPIPANVFNWNLTNVVYDGSTAPQHEIELYHIEDDGRYAIFDQYEPHLKWLSKDYYIPLCTQGILSAVAPAAVNPVVQDSWWNKFFTAVNNWFNNIPIDIPIGEVEPLV